MANFVAFQCAWLAAVLAAANGRPGLATLAVAAALAGHLWIVARPAVEARLIAAVVAMGFAIETIGVWQGHVAFPSGQPVSWLAPYWLVAMWALLATTLNVTLRALKRRPWVAAVLGAVAGPASFLAGERLGGARFVDAPAALAWLAASWAVAMPLLMALSNRFDGVIGPAPDPSPVPGPDPDPAGNQDGTPGGSRP